MKARAEAQKAAQETALTARTQADRLTTLTGDQAEEIRSLRKSAAEADSLRIQNQIGWHVIVKYGKMSAESGRCCTSEPPFVKNLGRSDFTDLRGWNAYFSRARSATSKRRRASTRANFSYVVIWHHLPTNGEPTIDRREQYTMSLAFLSTQRVKKQF